MASWRLGPSARLARPRWARRSTLAYVELPLGETTARPGELAAPELFQRCGSWDDPTARRTR
eukprot:363291-Chlamydomonas_euryale.AAC.24